MSLDWRTRQKFHADRMSIFSESLYSCFPELDSEQLLEYVNSIFVIVRNRIIFGAAIG